MVTTLSQVGGRQILTRDRDPFWWFGYVPPKQDDVFWETPALQHIAGIYDSGDEKRVKQAAADTLAAMPDFAISGQYKDTDKAYLWEVYPLTNKSADLFKVFYQQTGSCVGNGVGQAMRTLMAIEIVRLGDPEEMVMPFWLLCYGKSREYAGMRGRGEGSLGSTAAKAAEKDGFLIATAEGLERWQDQNGLTWGREAELRWSDGAAIEAKWLETSRQHIIKSAANVRNADQVTEAIINGYPVTIASMWGGQMQCQVQGNPGRLMNRRTGRWAHQMSVHGYERHPELGEIYYILNSWGVRAHGGPCPSGAPLGGFWVKKADMQSIVSEGDSFAFSQFDGFPSQELSWLI